MRAAFVAIIGAEPGAIPGHVIELVRAEQPPAGTGFVASAHVDWSSDDGSVLVGAWRELPDEAGELATWHVPAVGGIAVLTGHARERGKSWKPSSAWPELLVPLLDDPGSPAGCFDGAYAGLVLDRAGRGRAVCDAFAERSLFLAECGTHQVVASNAALAGWAITPARERPRLDAWAVCGLPYTRHRVGERTGFAGVRSLPMGWWAEIEPAQGVRAVEGPAPWRPDDHLRELSRDELLDLVEAVLVEQLAAVPTFDAATTLIDLTGGKDSRLVMAAAMLAGITDRIGFRTDGPPTVPDVVIAGELAAMTGIDWYDRPGLEALRESMDSTSRYDVPRPAWAGMSWPDRMRHYVSITAGVHNIWHAKELTLPSRTTRISGLTGEVLRSTLTFVAPTGESLIRRFDRHYGQLDLLLPDAFDRYREQWIEMLIDDPRLGDDWNDRHDAFLLLTQVRGNFNAREELTGLHRVMPLSTRDAVQVAFALGGEARSSELVHREVMRRARPELAEHRFVKGGWQEVKPVPEWAVRRRRFARLRQLGARYPRRIDRPVPEGPARAKEPANVADHRRREQGSAERVGLLRDVLADPDNEAWSIIDRDAVAAATERYDDLPRGAQVELMGAATAAIWLARGPG